MDVNVAALFRTGERKTSKIEKLYKVKRIQPSITAITVYQRTHRQISSTFAKTAYRKVSNICFPST